jgi:hypothetical protein
MLIRVPNYENVTVSGTLTSNAFDGYRYGVVAFRVHGVLTGDGTISMYNRGFPGAPNGSVALGYSAGGNAQSNLGWEPESNGGGGGYATTGGVGGTEWTAGTGGGVIYGNPQLGQLFMGSGGGISNVDWIRDCPTCEWHSQGKVPGGAGGGIVFIAGQTINFTGSIAADGSPKLSSQSPDNLLMGGAGAGGSIRIEGNTITLGTVSANGGSSTDTYG